MTRGRPFVTGGAGGPGRSKGCGGSILPHLKRVLEQPMSNRDKRTRAEALATAMVLHAISGKVGYASIIMDRIDGQMDGLTPSGSHTPEEVAQRFRNIMAHADEAADLEQPIHEGSNSARLELIRLVVSRAETIDPTIVTELLAARLGKKPSLGDVDTAIESLRDASPALFQFDSSTEPVTGSREAEPKPASKAKVKKKTKYTPAKKKGPKS